MAAADLNAIRGTIETHFLAGFGADLISQSEDTIIDQSGLIIVTQSPEADATPRVFRNQSYKPTPQDSFVQCLVTFGNSEYLTLGGTTDSFNQISGTIEVNVFTPKGIGPGANFDLADTVCALFSREIIEGIQVGPPAGPTVIVSSQPESFFQSRVTASFNVFEQL